MSLRDTMARITDIDEMLGEDIIFLEHTTKFFSTMHSQGTCLGEHCTIHNRSNHSMRIFPQHWRGDRMLMERICPHGIGHPDPDEINLDKDGRSVHGCDGCCMPHPPTRFRDMSNGE